MFPKEIQKAYINNKEILPVNIDDSLPKDKMKTFLRNKTTHIGWVDDVFKMKEFRDILDEIVGFKENIGDLNANSNTKGREMIQKLREGIRNGTIVKEMKPDGSYIWKKVRK